MAKAKNVDLLVSVEGNILPIPAYFGFGSWRHTIIAGSVEVKGYVEQEKKIKGDKIQREYVLRPVQDPAEREQIQSLLSQEDSLKGLPVSFSAENEQYTMALSLPKEGPTIVPRPTPCQDLSRFNTARTYQLFTLQYSKS